MTESAPPLVGVIMGSRSDWVTMKQAAETLQQFGAPFETKIVSAHRTPDWMTEYANSAAGRGIEVIIAGAGGAAHLPGMVAGHTLVPVIGVPIQSHGAQRSGLVALHRANARRCAGGDDGHRTCWRRQRRAHGRCHSGQQPARLPAGARRVSPGKSPPGHGRRTHDGGRVGRSAMENAILPGATIGIFGSGQLGRMMTLAAKRLGYRVHTFSPEADSPTGQVADREVVAAYDDGAAVDAFARRRGRRDLRIRKRRRVRSRHSGGGGRPCSSWRLGLAHCPESHPREDRPARRRPAGDALYACPFRRRLGHRRRTTQLPDRAKNGLLRV